MIIYYSVNLFSNKLFRFKILQEKKFWIVVYRLEKLISGSEKEKKLKCICKYLSWFLKICKRSLSKKSIFFDKPNSLWFYLLYLFQTNVNLSSKWLFRVCNPNNIFKSSYYVFFHLQNEKKIKTRLGEKCSAFYFYLHPDQINLETLTSSKTTSSKISIKVMTMSKVNKLKKTFLWSDFTDGILKDYFIKNSQWGWGISER